MHSYSHSRISKTTRWKQMRERVIKRDKYRCVKCKSRTNLTVHHKTYVRKDKEKQKDLITLCQRCHTRLHQTDN